MVYLIILIHLLFKLTTVNLLEVLNSSDFSFEESSKLVKMVTFNNGRQYPILGLGTWQAKSDVDDSEKADIYYAVKSAIDLGYRHFDCASIYNNEDYIGKAIKEKIEEGIIKREDIFVTSKLWNSKHNPKKVEGELRKSLKLLQLDYLDLYLIHWPVATIDDTVDSVGMLQDANYSYLDTWKAMERCVDLGLTKSIGLSNFNIKQVNDILQIAKIKPVVNQVENHPYLTQNVLKEFCESNGVLLAAYGPLGSPYRVTNPINLLEEPVVEKLANKYRKTRAQILIRFQVQRGIIVIPKSINPARQEENMQIWDFEMSKKDMTLLESLDQNLRFVLFIPAMKLKDYPFAIEVKD